MPEPIVPAHSPTGTPVIPPKAVPWITAVAALATAGMATFPSHTVAWKVCAGLTGLFGILGIASPGIRRQ